MTTETLVEVLRVLGYLGLLPSLFFAAWFYGRAYDSPRAMLYFVLSLTAGTFFILLLTPVSFFIARTLVSGVQP